MGFTDAPRAAANAAGRAVARQIPHQRALEIDPIVPRNQSGTGDLSNLQALCIAESHSGALFPAPGILATVQNDHEDFSALLAEIDGIGKSTQHHPADLTVDQGKRLRRDENALNRSSNGFGKVLGQRRLTRAVPALGFQKNPPPPLAGSQPRGASSEAELAAHFIPGHCCARVGEMGRPAPIQLSAEGRIDRQRPISGLVIEAVPEGDRQSKPFVLGQLKKV